MGDFLKAWLHNLWITLAAVVGVALLALLFTKIFYPDAFSLLFLSGQFAVGLVSTLKWWPLVILAIIVSALPRPRRRRSGYR